MLIIVADHNFVCYFGCAELSDFTEALLRAFFNDSSKLGKAVLTFKVQDRSQILCPYCSKPMSFKSMYTKNPRGYLGQHQLKIKLERYECRNQNCPCQSDPALQKSHTVFPAILEPRRWYSAVVIAMSIDKEILSCLKMMNQLSSQEKELWLKAMQDFTVVHHDTVCRWQSALSEKKILLFFLLLNEDKAVHFITFCAFPLKVHIGAIFLMSIKKSYLLPDFQSGCSPPCS